MLQSANLRPSFAHSTDFDVNTTTYHTEGVPISQVRKLNFNDNDQAFMNNFRAHGAYNYFMSFIERIYESKVSTSLQSRCLHNRKTIANAFFTDTKEK